MQKMNKTKWNGCIFLLCNIIIISNRIRFAVADLYSRGGCKTYTSVFTPRPYFVWFSKTESGHMKRTAMYCKLLSKLAPAPSDFYFRPMTWRYSPRFGKNISTVCYVRTHRATCSKNLANRDPPVSSDLNSTTYSCTLFRLLRTTMWKK